MLAPARGLWASVLCLATIQYGIAQAASWPSDPNTNVPICTDAADQDNPAIASDSFGGAIITWYDYRDISANIYAQRVNWVGAPQWTANGVALCTTGGARYYPAIVSDGVGGAIVTWEDLGNDGIYAQRVNAAGIPQWTAAGVTLCAGGGQLNPSIASDGAGGAIVTWYDYRSGNGDIYAQRVSAAGVPLWTADGVAVCTAANEQSTPTIAIDGGGGAIVAWQDGRDGTLDIYAQRVSAAGVPQWTEDGTALCTAANSQASPAIISDGAGGAIVTWVDQRGGNRHIYVQRVDGAGVPEWTDDGLALCKDPNGQVDPTMLPDGTGGAIVTWSDGRGGIHAQRVNAVGVPQWTTDGIALSTAAGGQQLPTITSNGAGGAIVAWQDHRSGGPDVYAQNINAGGTLGDPLAAKFALLSVQPNPSIGDLRVSFSLMGATSPATLALYDLAGRRIESQSLDALAPGAHVASLSRRAPSWPPGIYFVNLTQGTHRAFSKIAIVR